MNPFRRWFPFVAALVLALAPTRALAHALSDGYVSLVSTNGRLSGRLELSLHDLEEALGLDANGDGNVTWGELQQRQAEVRAYLQSRFTAGIDGQPVPLQVGDLQVNQRNDEGFVVAPLLSETLPAGRELTLTYTLLFELDPLHLGLLKFELNGAPASGIFAANHTTLTFPLTAAGGHATSAGAFGQFVREGVWHIWIGTDHILFLVALLLPAVLIRSADRWEPVRAFRPAVVNVVKVVTAFTVAHSITLSLAVLDWVHLPSRWVESVIAASVVIAAANNLRPFVRERGWLVAFGFGLIHGFGFAGVLAELELPRGALAAGLVGFNLGVELGQLAIVAVFLPVAFLLRSTWAYRRLALQTGSVLIALVAALWFVERAFDLGFMPF